MAENTNQNQEETSRKKKGTGITTLLIILAVLVGVMTWLYISQKLTTQRITTEYEEITNELQSEKDSIQAELVEIKTGYDSLKTISDTLNQQLNLEQERIDNLLSELKTVKASNYTRIKELKDEVGTLRNIAQSYVRQIDSLNRANKQLIAENRRVKEEMEVVRESKDQLEKVKDTLSEKVERASVLRTEDLRAIPINQRGKQKDQVDKIDKIRVCFTIDENVVAPQGERYVYMRIAAPPDDFILTNSEDNLFEYNGKQIVYTARRPIEFNGEAMEVCLYFDSQGELKPGEYEAYIFADGYQIGETSFKLEESGWLFF